jgi:hypothetical protein
MITKTRTWLANALVDLACWVEPPSKLTPMLNQIASEAKLQGDLAGLLVPPTFKPIEERRFTTTDEDGDRLYFAVTKSLSTELRHIATDCETGAVRGFRLTWMGPPHPMQAVTYPPRGDAKA